MASGCRPAIRAAPRPNVRESMHGRRSSDPCPLARWRVGQAERCRAGPLSGTNLRIGESLPTQQFPRGGTKRTVVVASPSFASFDGTQARGRVLHNLLIERPHARPRGPSDSSERVLNRSCRGCWRNCRCRDIPGSTAGGLITWRLEPASNDPARTPSLPTARQPSACPSQPSAQGPQLQQRNPQISDQGPVVRNCVCQPKSLAYG